MRAYLELLWSTDSQVVLTFAQVHFMVAVLGYKMYAIALSVEKADLTQQEPKR